MLATHGSERNPKFISYGQFRNFMMLLPQDVVAMDSDPSKVWFEAATMVEFAKPQGSGGTFSMALKAALAGGCASAMSTSTLHPIDTLKTRLQATVGKGPGMFGILKSVPRNPAGVRTLYHESCRLSLGISLGTHARSDVRKWRD